MYQYHRISASIAAIAVAFAATFTCPSALNTALESLVTVSFEATVLEM